MNGDAYVAGNYILLWGPRAGGSDATSESQFSLALLYPRRSPTLWYPSRAWVK